MSRTRISMRCGPAALAGLLGSVCAVVLSVTSPRTVRAQVFRSGTSLVPIDVRVLDRDGRPITDLTAADFTVIEDGAPQEIRHFSTQDFTGHGPAAEAVTTVAPAATALMPAQQQRVFLIVLSNGRLQIPAKGVDGMLHFIQRALVPGDRVAVLAYNRGTEFTTDHARILGVLDRFKTLHEKIYWDMRGQLTGLAAIYGNHQPMKSVQADINYVFDGSAGPRGRTLAAAAIPNQRRIDEDTRRVTDLLMGGSSVDPIGAEIANQMGVSLDEFVTKNAESMEDLNRLYLGISYLRNLEGEKHLIYVVENGLTLPRWEDDRDLARVAADARVALDIVQTGGVGSVVVAQTSYLLAGMTGGQYFANRFKNAAMDLDRINLSASFQYLLGYYPRNTEWNGKFRKIEVKIRRPGATVLFRHGYYARPAPPSFDRRVMITTSRMSGAIRHPRDIPDLAFRATATEARGAAGEAEIQVDATIDLTRVGFTKDAGRNVGAIEVGVLCADQKGLVIGERWQRIAIDLADDRLAAVRSTGVPYRVRVPVTGRVRQAKIILYDFESDLLGSHLVKITTAPATARD